MGEWESGEAGRGRDEAVVLREVGRDLYHGVGGSVTNFVNVGVFCVSPGPAAGST